MQRPGPALVIATTLLALQNQYKPLSREAFGYFVGPKAFFVPIASALPLPTLNSLRCVCVHFPVFEIN